LTLPYQHSLSESIFAQHPVATGVAVGAICLLPHFFLSPEMSLAFAAILLGVVAGVYFGFAVVKGSNFQQQIEFNVAFLFVIAALLGVGFSPWFLPAAYLARLYSAVVHSVVRRH
jgi:hypothetical protein